MTNKRILLTAALPYANSPVHIGHLVEHFQADFWHRFQNMVGNDCVFFCADDTHGTPIMIAAKNLGLSPEVHVNNVWKEHVADFANCQIEFTHYSSTNSQANKELCEYFYSQIKKKSHLLTKSIEQLYCNHDQMFLPDRFVKGTCPKCGTLDQYGDNCDKCGATYSTTDLKKPYCSLCKNTPVIKSSEHLLFQLSHFQKELEDWLPKHTTKEVANKMKEWFSEPLRNWDISRDSPYFGFEIPGMKDKFFYVWVDAPMGYVSTTSEWCIKTGKNFDDYWRSEKTEVIHLIGKDIIYFHTLFWPAFLSAAEFRKPSQVVVHGHLTVNGEKMSKSKGTQIMAKTYLKHLDIVYLRYYFAAKMNSGMDDFDFSPDDFAKKVNSELIGKITNLGSRGAQMLNKNFAGKMSTLDQAGTRLVQMAQEKGDLIADYFHKWDFAKAIAEIRSLAEEGNRYFDEKAPWKTVAGTPVETAKVLTATLNLFRILCIYLKPVLPVYAKNVEGLFNQKDFTWKDSKSILENFQIKEYIHLAQKVDLENVKNMMADALTSSQTVAAGSAPATDTQEIDIDTFAKVDLRVGKIIEAQAIPEADKLLKLKIDLGPLGTRQIFAGIKSAYQPELLIGRLTVIVANLKPRKMKFGMSEGMVLAAGAGGAELYILSPDSGAKPGDKVK